MSGRPPLAELFSIGEQIGVEFKGPGPLTEKALRAQVVRAMLGFSNRRDGGIIVVGVDAAPGRFTTPGISRNDLPTWSPDLVADAVAAYAAPSVIHRVEQEDYDGKTFVVIHVGEFEDIPVLCRKSYGDVLHDGALYVRGRRKPETTPVRSEADMRDLLELAIEKRLRAYVATAERARLRLATSAPVDDRRAYDQQAGDL